MGNGIYVALSGALTDTRRVEVISNNLANAKSAGFKQFQMAAEAVKGADGSNEMTFAVDAPPQIDFRLGDLNATESPMDIALTEGVFMAVRDGNQTAYRRGGSLIIRPDGIMINQEGQTIMGKEDQIKIPEGQEHLVTIRTDGTVVVDGNEFDQIRLTEFRNLQGLRKADGSTLVDTGRAEPITVETKYPVMVGYREEGNISLISGMTDLITAQRSYEAALKTVETFSHIEKRTARDIHS